ncbi:MAG TPA: hypothetical protein P5136_00780 [Methanofastidiosum sp.]|nr:hypothetical protein [Methanofastidiosum sp.]
MKKIYALLIDDGYTIRSSLGSFGILVEDEEIAKQFVEKTKGRFYNVSYKEMFIVDSLEEILNSDQIKNIPDDEWYRKQGIIK